ncbi:MAG: hypothetical protein RLZZ66_2153 [Pseudomonadota bacterium]
MSTVRFRPRAPFLVLSQYFLVFNARVAQLVEQRIENPCVDGSIPPPGTTDNSDPAVLQTYRLKDH